MTIPRRCFADWSDDDLDQATWSVGVLRDHMGTTPGIEFALQAFETIRAEKAARPEALVKPMCICGNPSGIVLERKPPKCGDCRLEIHP